KDMEFIERVGASDAEALLQWWIARLNVVYSYLADPTNFHELGRHGRTSVAAGQLERRPLMEMLYGAIDIHKHVFQAAVFDAASGEVVEERFPATRERLADWAMAWQGKLAAAA